MTSSVKISHCSYASSKEHAMACISFSCCEHPEKCAEANHSLTVFFFCSTCSQHNLVGSSNVSVVLSHHPHHDRHSGCSTGLDSQIGLEENYSHLRRRHHRLGRYVARPRNTTEVAITFTFLTWRILIAPSLCEIGREYFGGRARKLGIYVLGYQPIRLQGQAYDPTFQFIKDKIDSSQSRIQLLVSVGPTQTKILREMK